MGASSHAEKVCVVGDGGWEMGMGVGSLHPLVVEEYCSPLPLSILHVWSLLGVYYCLVKLNRHG